MIITQQCSCFVLSSIAVCSCVVGMPQIWRVFLSIVTSIIVPLSCLPHSCDAKYEYSMFVRHHLADCFGIFTTMSKIVRIS